MNFHYKPMRTQKKDQIDGWEKITVHQTGTVTGVPAPTAGAPKRRGWLHDSGYVYIIMEPEAAEDKFFLRDIVAPGATISHHPTPTPRRIYGIVDKGALGSFPTFAVACLAGELIARTRT